MQRVNLEEMARRLTSASQREREEALAELMRGLYGWVSQRIPPDVPAQVRAELIQDVFTRVYRYRGDGPVRNLLGWLHEITRNVYRTWRESERRRALRGVDESFTPEDPEGESIHERFLVSDEPGPERFALAREKVAFLKEAISGLPPQMRRSLLLHLRGLTVRQIAIGLDIAEGTVKAHVHAARERLKQELRAAFPPRGELDRTDEP